MYVFLYTLFLFVFRLGIQLAAIKNAKARQWIAGRKDIFDRLKIAIPAAEKIIWFHCASLGEFEQGRPVIEKMKVNYPGYKILITFFSPSGYEVRKNFELADYIFYLPLDSRAHAKRFLDIVHPSLVIFVKYEFWYYYFTAIRERQIPFLLISSVFRKEQPFFRWYGSLYRKMLACFSHLFVQDRASQELLSGIELRMPVSIAGDTRFDRVAEIAGKFTPLPVIEKYVGNSRLIVAGSTWPDDEKMLQQLMATMQDSSIKLVIAPHEIGTDHLDELRKLFPAAIFYSQLEVPGVMPADANGPLIIDSIGILARLYKYATIAYIGGGFTRDGIHNILEAAVYGKPVLFGPTYKKYREAIELIDAGGAVSFAEEAELLKITMTLLQDRTIYEQYCEAAADYVRNNAGATETILRYIQENRLLTR